MDPEYYDYNYSLYTPQNIFNLTHQATPRVVDNDLWINYQVSFLDTNKVIEDRSKSAFTRDYSLLPLAVRYSSPDGKTHIIERPPFEIEIDFSTATSYRPRTTPKYLQSVKMWIPWTVSVISTEYQSGSFSSSFVFHLYFNDGPLQSFDDKLVPCYLPNSSSGNICMGQDSLPTSQMIENGSSITDIYNHTFNSYFGGWNCDLSCAMQNLEYFAPIVEKISQNKKSAAIISNYYKRHNTAKYYKSLLYLLSNISLQEHIGYITYTKEKTSYHPTLRHHFNKSNLDSFILISQSHQNATAPWHRIARILTHNYGQYPSVVNETSFKVVIKNYQSSLILDYISNPYIVASIYKAMLNFDPDNLQNEFDHSEIAPYIKQSENI
jgi:hypothetical protein